MMFFFARKKRGNLGNNCDVFEIVAAVNRRFYGHKLRLPDDAYLKEYLEFFTLTKICKHTGAILFTILKFLEPLFLSV
jgi:hypothetical protein